MTNVVANNELKMWLIVRQDLNMPAGKLAAQAGHGFMNAAFALLAKSDPSNFDCEPTRRLREYMSGSHPKIVVRVKDERELTRAYDEASEANLSPVIIIDEGRTVFGEPTPTVVCVGPCYKEELPKFIQRLQLYKD